MSKPIFPSLPKNLADRASWLVNAGSEDTRQGTAAMTGTADDIAVLRAAIDYEKAHGNRVSRLDIMQSKLRRFTEKSESHLAKVVREKRETKAAAVEVTQDDPKDPAWDSIRQTISQVRAAGRAYLFGKAWLGWQLSVRKEQHRKAGGGRGGDRKSIGKTGPLTSWEEIVERETGLAKRTADHFIELFEATKAKLKREQKKLPEKKNALVILQSENPLALPPEQREFVQDVIASICDGETASSLMQELGVIKPPAAPPRGKKEQKDKLTPEQLAFDFFDGPASAIVNARASKQYKKLLYILPPVSDDPEKPSLTFLRDEMQAMVDDLNDALAKHAKKAHSKH